MNGCSVASPVTDATWLGVEINPSRVTSSNNRHGQHSLPMDARDLLYGLPRSVIVETCAVSLDTARRWKRTGRVPGPAVRLLELVTRGELGVFNPAWLGFRIIRDYIVTPSGFEIAPGQISALPYTVALLRELELKLSIPTQRKLF